MIDEAKDDVAPADGEFPAVDGIENMVDLVNDSHPDKEGDDDAEDTTDTDDAGSDKPDSSTNDEDVDIPEDLLGEDAPEDEEEEEPVPENLTEKDAAAFKSMREQIKELKNQAKSGDSEDIQALKDQLAEKDKIIAATDLSKSDAFQQAYKAPIEETKADLVTAGETYDISTQTIERLARATDPKTRLQLIRNEATDPAAAAELMPMLRTLDKQVASAQEAIDNHEATTKSLSSQSDEQQRQRFSSALSELQAEHFLLRESKSNPNWLKTVQNNAVAMATGKVGAEDMAKALLKAQVADGYRVMYMRSLKQIESLNSKLGIKKSVSPGLSARATKSSKAPENKVTSVEALAGL